MADRGNDSFAVFVFSLVEIENGILLKDKVRKHCHNKHAACIDPEQPFPALQELVDSSNC
jgi:hypothetical protein